MSWWNSKTDAYPEFSESIQPQPEEKFVEKMAEADAKLVEYIEQDEADEAAAKEFLPVLDITIGKASDYISFNGIDFPASFVESITVSHSGEAPRKHVWLGSGTCWASRARAATVSVKLFSGRAINYEISRWRADALLVAMIKAWREHR